MSEGLYAKFKREQEESEKEMARMREIAWQIEREKKEKTEANAEQRHRELIESMKKNSSIQISSGGDTNISGSNLAGGDLKEQSKKDADNHWYKKPVGIVVLAIMGGVILFVITTLLRHFYPHWFS